MKILYTANSLPEANFLLSLLQDNGIECMSLDEHHNSLAPHLSLALGVRVAVADRDWKEALEVFREYKGIQAMPERNRVSAPHGSNLCPSCGSTELQSFQKVSPILSVLAFIFFFIPLGVTKEFCRCCNCGDYWKVAKTQG